MKSSFTFFIILFIISSVIFSQEVSFSVVGDIMSHETQIRSAYRKDCDCWDYHFCFEYVKPFLKQTDFTIGNLETTLPGDRKLFSGYPQFGTPDELIDALLDAGFNILTLANNHSVDKGYEAFVRTKKIVMQKGIVPLGTFFDNSDFEKNKIFLIHKNGISFAFIHFSYGTNGISLPSPAKINLIDFQEIKKQIEEAKQLNPDLIILLLHYGTEYLTEPDNYQEFIVKFALKEGVDIILGGHPHVLQKFEKINLTDKYGNSKERFIAWSLGNFVSHQLRRNTYGGMILQFKVRKEQEQFKITDVDYIPVYVQFKNRHYILPIHEYIYFSDKKKSNSLIYFMDKTYYLHFFNERSKNLSDLDKIRMIDFLKSTLEIIKIFPNKMVIQ